MTNKREFEPDDPAPLSPEQQAARESGARCYHTWLVTDWPRTLDEVVAIRIANVYEHVGHEALAKDFRHGWLTAAHKR